MFSQFLHQAVGSHLHVRAVRVGILAIVLILATASQPAFGAIVVGRSIAGITMTMTAVQVRAKLGPPPKVLHGKNFFGPTTEWRYRTVAIVWMYDSIILMGTASQLERTSAGIGVGSTKTQVRKLIRGVRCEGSYATGLCSVGTQLPGHIVTVFRFARGRVTAVEIGRVLD